MKIYFKLVFLILILAFISQYSIALKPALLMPSELHYTYKEKFEKAQQLQGQEKLKEFLSLYQEVKTWLTGQDFPRATMERLHRSLLKLNHQIAYIYFIERDFKSAQEYLNEGLEIINKHEDYNLPGQKAYSMLQLAEIKRILGNEPESEKLLEKVNKIDLKFETRYKAFYHIGVARLKISRSKFTDAEIQIAKANSLANTLVGEQKEDAFVELAKTKAMLIQKQSKLDKKGLIGKQTEMLLQAAVKREKNSNKILWKQRQTELADIYLDQALTFYNSFRFDETIASVVKAYRIYSLKPDKDAEMLSIFGVGKCGVLAAQSYYQQGQFEKGIGYASGYLSFLQKKIGYSSLKAELLAAQGRSYLALGNADKAEEFISQAEKMLETSNDLGLLSRITRFRSELQTFNGQYGLALNSLNKSVVMARKAEDIREEMKSLRTIGQNFVLIRNLEFALLNFTDALKLAQKINNMADIILAKISIAQVHILTKNQLSYQKALGILREIEPEANKLELKQVKASVSDYIARLFYKFGNFTKAVEYCDIAIKNLGNVKPAYHIQLMIDKGRYLREANKLTEAENAIKQAYSIILSRFDDPYLKHQVFIEYALTFEKHDNLANAYLLYKKAEEEISKIRTEILDRENKAILQERNNLLYEKLVSLSYEMKEFNKSFCWSEAGKARAFLDKFADLKSGITKDIDPKLKEQELHIIESMGAYQNSLQQAESEVNPDKKEIANLKKNIAELTQEYQQLKIKIMKESPRFSSLTSPKPIKIKELQNSLTEDNIFLSYLLGVEKSFLFIVTKTNFIIETLPKQKIIADKVVYHRDLIISGAAIGLPEFMKSATELGKILLKPASDLLSKHPKLIIAPSGILHYLPFETLIIRETPESFEHTWATLPYVVNQLTSVNYVQSATVMQFINAEQKPKTELTLAAFGDPVFPYEYEIAMKFKSAIGESTERAIFGNIFPRLPNTSIEVTEISKLVQESPLQKSFLRYEATEENLKKIAPQAKYLHIATHGILSEDNPTFSGLIMTTNPVSKEDGFCYLIEIYNMQLNAELITLSACQTGLGKLYAGEGIEGLSRAFMYAGAKRTLVSLWSVDDASTSEFMKSFYNLHFKSDESISVALTLAKKKMISSKKFSAPYFWSPFVLLGSTKNIEK